MLSHLEIARTVFYGSEALAVEGPDGVWGSTALGPRAFHLQTMRIYRRFVEIVHILGGGGFFYAPTKADFDNPEERPYIDRYVRGRPGISAEERVRLFKLAWDVTGSGFAQRMAQYVTFYSGDPVRLTAAFYVGYDKDPLCDIVDRALDVCFINTPPVPQSFSWERHAPAWLLEPAWSPAIPGESTGEGLTKWTSSLTRQWLGWRAPKASTA